MNPVSFRHFGSLAEYAALERSRYNKDKGHPNHNNGQRHWYGVDNAVIAKDIIKAGVWEEGSRRMEKELAGFEVAPARSIKRRGQWSDQGDSLDIHKVYSGSLDTAWRRTVRRPMHSSSNIVISFPLIVSSRDHADKFFYCGAAALKLSDILTTAGYNVMIVGTHGTTGLTSRTCFDSLIVKDAGSPLDVEALVVAMTFPGFSRITGFTAICSNDFPVQSGLGSAHYDAREPLDALGFPAANIIHGLYHKVSGLESARKWVAEQVTKIEAAASFSN